MILQYSDYSSVCSCYKERVMMKEAFPSTKIRKFAASMATSRLMVLKFVLIGVFTVGMVSWNVQLQRKVTQLEDKAAGDVIRRRNTRQKRSIDGEASNVSGGAVFVRWGRKTCPNADSEMVYSGIVGGAFYDSPGGGSDYVCLTREPQYDRHSDRADAGSRIYGVEYEIYSTDVSFDQTNAPDMTNSLHDTDAVCAVCRSKVRKSQIMIPGRKECYPGWKREYHGYLVAQYYGYAAQHNYICVDEAPEADDKSKENKNGGLMYLVHGICGSLPCPEYVNNRELTCVVCSK